MTSSFWIEDISLLNVVSLYASATMNLVLNYPTTLSRTASHVLEKQMCSTGTFGQKEEEPTDACSVAMHTMAGRDVFNSNDLIRIFFPPRICCS